MTARCRSSGLQINDVVIMVKEEFCDLENIMSSQRNLYCNRGKSGQIKSVHLWSLRACAANYMGHNCRLIHKLCTFLLEKLSFSKLLISPGIKGLTMSYLHTFQILRVFLLTQPSTAAINTPTLQIYGENSKFEGLYA